LGLDLVSNFLPNAKQSFRGHGCDAGVCLVALQDEVCEFVVALIQYLKKDEVVSGHDHELLNGIFRLELDHRLRVDLEHIRERIKALISGDRTFFERRF